MAENEEVKKKERAAIFIDGSNLYHNLRDNKIKISFEELIKKIESKREIANIYYYTANLDEYYNLEKYQNHQKFLARLRKIPNFHVVICTLRKVAMPDGSFDFDIKGDDVHLASDLIKGSYENSYDVAIIVSGDADFIPAIKIAQSNGKKIINAFFPKSSSYLLRNCCDKYFDLKNALIKKRSPNTAKP